MKKKWFAVVLALLGVFSGKAVGQTLDQSFDTGSFGFIQRGLIPGSYVAQIYTAGISGSLASVSIAAGSGNTATVQIRNVVSGVPGSIILGATTVAIPPLSSFFSLTSVPFSSVIPQVAGTQYAIVVTTDAGGFWNGAGGTEGFFTSADGVNWAPVCQGCIYELFFQTFVSPVVPNYSSKGFQSPFDIALSLNKKTNRAIPLKAQLFDSNGNLVTPDTLAGAAPPVVNVSYNSGSSTAVNDTSLLDPLGDSSSGNQFSYDVTTQTWWFNLSSVPFSASGTYTVTLQSGDATKYKVSPVCTGTFVRQ